MRPRRNKEKFHQLKEFDRGRIIGLREGGFSYRAIGVRVKRNSSTVMRVWKQWTDEHRTSRKIVNGRQKRALARDDQHLLRISVNDRTSSSRQSAARCSNATGVLMSASSIHRPLLRSGWVPLYRISHTANHRRLRLQWAHEHRAWQADWHTKLSFQMNHASTCGTMMAAFMLDAMPVNAAYIEWHSGLILRVMVCGAISYHGRSSFLGNEAQHRQLLPWSAYSLDMSPIEHVWYLVGRRLACDLSPASSKDELLLLMQAIWNSLPEADIPKSV
ncbi:transposable element Tcb2 transposase [Trichonephila clavipes]|nr:transposable element Tcb2 transposase [Trichonephila clavipes]